jgi:glycine/D-amino acid oxidase-like deaminating enzyme/nitrite reductase/ring-hydroxylating ferredoxin subunit
MVNNTVSYWNKTAQKVKYPRLESSVETQTLIIGGGITGVTCAYCLAQKGEKAVLIEAGGLCDGTTGNTTGKVTLQHGIIYSPIYEKYGGDFAKQYFQSQLFALEFVKEMVKKESIDCQLAENTAYIYTTEEGYKERLEREYEVALELGIDAQLIENPNFPQNNILMLGYRNQAVFHSVRYVQALAKAASEKGVEIYCDTKAIDLEDGDIKTVHCENGIDIKAKHVLMATQYPFYDGLNLFFTRLYADRDYGIAVAAKRDWPDGSFIRAETPIRSIRTHVENGEKILIVVGEGHATGRGEDNMELHFERLVNFAEEIAGVQELLAKWSAQDYDTPDQIPYIGRLSGSSNIYVAAGFGKWGLTNGTLAGNLTAELITTGKCRYEELYSRSRGDMSKAGGKVVSEFAAAVGELIKSKFEKTEGIENLKQGEGRLINFAGKKAGIYRDFDDKVTVVDTTCTHMGTEINFNVAEKTWDCPAHGGRFSSTGKLLEGPPKDDLKLLYEGKFSDLSSR